MRWVELVMLNVYGKGTCVCSVLTSILAGLYLGALIQLTTIYNCCV